MNTPNTNPVSPETTPDIDAQNEEALLAQFFSDHRSQVADNGFSRRVMKAVEQETLGINVVRMRRRARVWRIINIAVALIFFFVFNGPAHLFSVLSALGCNLLYILCHIQITPAWIISALCCFALIILYRVLSIEH